MRISLFTGALLSAVALGCTAHAADFDFMFTGTAGSGISGSGVITADGADPAGSYFTPSLQITGISGTFDGKNISTLLPPGTFYATSGVFGTPGNDNILYYPSSQSYMGQPTYLDRQGVSFTAGNATYNLYFGLGGYGELKQGAQGKLSSDVGGTFTLSPAAVSAAPEPGVWALMFAGVAMIGAALRFGRRRQAAVLAI